MKRGHLQHLKPMLMGWWYYLLKTSLPSAASAPLVPDIDTSVVRRGDRSEAESVMMFSCAAVSLVRAISAREPPTEANEGAAKMTVEVVDNCAYNNKRVPPVGPASEAGQASNSDDTHERAAFTANAPNSIAHEDCSLATLNCYE